MTTTETPLRAAKPPTRSAVRGWGRLVPVLRSELIKAATVRTPRILLAAAAVAGLLISWATAAFDADEGLTVTDLFVYPTLLTAVLAAISGVLSFTSEVQHGTLPASFTANPSRWPAVAAKTVLAAGLGLALGLVGMAAGAIGSLAGGVEVGEATGVATTVGWALMYTVGAALLGLGVGMVVRHSAGAVSGLLVWWLVVEGLVVSFAPAEVVRFVPFDAGARTLDIATDLDRPEVLAAALPAPLHASIFWGWVLGVLVLGTVLLMRRDVD